MVIVVQCCVQVARVGSIARGLKDYGPGAASATELPQPSYHGQISALDIEWLQDS